MKYIQPASSRRTGSTWYNLISLDTFQHHDTIAPSALLTYPPDMYEYVSYGRAAKIGLSENLRNSQTRLFIIILPVKMLGVLYPSFRHPGPILLDVGRGINILMMTIMTYPHDFYGFS